MLRPVSSFKAFAVTFSAGWLSLALSACSPSMFGSALDPDAAHLKNYRKLNPACDGMNLSSETMDATVVRSLTRCLNANGGINEIASWLDQLSDQQVNAMLELPNQYVFGNPTVLYQLIQTHSTLSQKAMIEPALASLGRLLKYEDVIVSSIGALREGYRRGSRQELLKTLEAVGGELSGSGVERALNVGMTFTGSPALHSFLAKFRGGSRSGVTLERVTREVMAYLQTGTPESVAIGRELLQAVSRDEIFRALDSQHFLGNELSTNVPRFAAALDQTLSRNGYFFNGLSSLFHFLNVPVYCLDRAKKVANADLHVIDEIVLRPTSEVSEFIRRDHKLKLTAINAFCEYPKALSTYYSYLESFADLPAVEPMADLMKAFHEVGKTDLMVNVLSEVGHGEMEDKGGVKLFIPALTEVAERGANVDLLLLAALAGSRTRADLEAGAQVLLAPREQLASKSIYDVLTETLSKLDFVTLYRLASSFDSIVNSNANLAYPALSQLRNAYHVNDAHPVVDAMSAILTHASVHPKSIEAFLEASDAPAFRGAIRQMAEMAEDGRLKEIADFMLTLLQKYSQRGRVAIHETEIPAFTSDARHALSSADFGPYSLQKVGKSTANAACGALNINASLADFNAPEFDSQIQNWGACLNSDKKHGNGQKAIEFLRTYKTESGKSFLEFQIDLIRKMDFSASEWRPFIDSSNRSYDNGSLFKTLDSIPYWVSMPFSGGPVLRPAFSLAPTITQEGYPALRNIETFLSRILRREDFPLVVDEVSGILHSLDRVSSRPSQPSKNIEAQREKVKAWVEAKECVSDEAKLSSRADEIFYEFKNAITVGDLQSRPLFEVSRQELRARLQEIFKKAVAPHAAGRTLIHALLNTLRYFNLQQGERPNQTHQFPAEYLLKWLQEKANDHHKILYYYPGESFPRVRYVNSLDRLEMVLMQNDFQAPGLPTWFPVPDDWKTTNYSIAFLKEFGDAWGDEPEELWPDEIRRKFHGKKGKRPLTLRQAYEKMLQVLDKFEGILGTVEIPKCQRPTSPEDPDTTQDHYVKGLARTLGLPSTEGIQALRQRIFNTRQVLSVIEENLPERGSGGMKVLRNMFFEFAYTTPKNHQSSLDEMNNLRAVMDLVNLGLDRQLGLFVMDLPDGDSALVDFFRRLVRAVDQDFVYEIADLVPEPGMNPLNLLQLIDDNSQTSVALDQLVERMKALDANPGYQALKDSSALLKALEYFGSETGPENQAAARKIRGYLATRLDDRDLDQFLIVMRDKPDDVYRVLEALSDSARDGGLKDFFGVMRRSLVDGFTQSR